MHVIYEPQGDPSARQVWTFDPDQVYADEAALIEDHFGKPWDMFVAQVRARQMGALKLLLWHLMRQGGPGAARSFANLKDVPRFRTGEVTLQASVAELDAQWQQIERSTGVLTPQELEIARGQYDTERAIAVEREGKPADMPPAAPAGDVVEVPEVPPTSEPSPTFGAATG